MDLVQCAYCSRSVDPFFGSKELEQLLGQCRKNNERLGVTGMLLFEKTSFFQVLEGPSDSVAFLIEKIARDSRHESMLKVVHEPIGKRSFGDWSMGYPDVTLDQLAEIPGLNDFFVAEQSSFLNIDPGRARKLLEAFKSGSFRRALAYW